MKVLAREVVQVLNTLANQKGQKWH